MSSEVKVDSVVCDDCVARGQCVHCITCTRMRSASARFGIITLIYLEQFATVTPLHSEVARSTDVGVLTSRACTTNSCSRLSEILLRLERMRTWLLRDTTQCSDDHHWTSLCQLYRRDINSQNFFLQYTARWCESMKIQLYVVMTHTHTCTHL